ncbi:porin [Limibacterium fermenti]|uniref:porin n=1 Tax=Limibacterium fermenti TaxID=3229863 RepID=UPI0026818634
MGYKFIMVCILTFISCYVSAQVEDDMDMSIEGLEDISVIPDSLFEVNAPIVHKYYLGNGLRFSSPDGNYMMNLTGYVQSTFLTQTYSGDDDLYSRWRVRRARIRLNGYAMKDRIRYRIGIDMVKGSESSGDTDSGDMLMDAWVAYRPWGNSRLSITFGQRSTMTDNRENFMSSSSLQLSERSRLASIFGTIREVGVFAQGSYKVGADAYLRPALAITDGDGGFTFGKRYGGLKYGARVNYYPFGLFRDGGDYYLGDKAYEVSPKLSLGASYSYNDGTSDRRGGNSSGDILYLNEAGNVDLPDFARTNLDFFFKYRGWNFMAEYTKTWAYVPSTITSRVRADGSTSDSFEIDGEQNIENYIKNRLILGSAFNLQGGYLFRNFWTVNARYTHIIPDKYSYLNNDLYYKRNDIFEFSVAKYLTNDYSTKIQLTASFYKTDGEVRYSNGTFSGYETLFNVLTQISF